MKNWQARGTKPPSSEDHTFHRSRDQRHHAQAPRKQPSIVQEKTAMPQPLGDRCNPLCPLFVCTRNAMFVINKPVKSRMVRVAQCRLTGGDCINGECQYSSCRINALLPDGRCTKALERKQSRLSDEEMFRQMRSLEEYDIRDFMR